MHEPVNPTATGPKAKAISGLHEAVAVHVQRLVPSAHRILDIAAGNGAFTKRLRDLDYEVVANDLDPSGWALPEVALLQIDLNTSFASQFADRGIQVITAIEIIEHLENPRAFLRECRAIVPPGGYLFVTTPNVTSAMARAMFLRSGTMPFFYPQEYHSSGHLTILPQWLLVEHALATQWQVWNLCFAGDYGPSTLIQSLGQACARLLGRYRDAGESRGGCTCLVLQKA